MQGRGARGHADQLVSHAFAPPRNGGLILEDPCAAALVTDHGKHGDGQPAARCSLSVRSAALAIPLLLHSGEAVAVLQLGKGGEVEGEGIEAHAAQFAEEDVHALAALPTLCSHASRSSAAVLTSRSCRLPRLDHSVGRLPVWLV